MKRLDSSLVSLVGFAASQWAQEQESNGHNGGKPKRRLRQIVAAGLEIHTRAELYASAPVLLRSLQRVATHATITLERTAPDEVSALSQADPAQVGSGGNGSKGRQGNGGEQGADKRPS
jgi:hypothetical protein